MLWECWPEAQEPVLGHKILELLIVYGRPRLDEPAGRVTGRLTHSKNDRTAAANAGQPSNGHTHTHYHKESDWPQQSLRSTVGPV